VRLAALAEAERLRATGEAEAAAIRARGEAEAAALALRAEAYQKFNEAAVIQTVLSALPEVVRAAAEPMGNIDQLTVLSSDGASDLVRNTTRTVAEAAAALKGLTGIDLQALLSRSLSDAARGSGSSGNGHAVAAAVPDARPSTPPPPVDEPGDEPAARTQSAAASPTVSVRLPDPPAFEPVPPPPAPPAAAVSPTDVAPAPATEDGPRTPAEGLELVRQLANDVKASLDYERLQDMTLSELLERGPERIRRRARRVPAPLLQAFGRMKVRDLVDRFSR
jgi:flotillin